MKGLPLCLLAVCLACSGPVPLHIASVERTGLPPYEDADRLYRVEGEGWERLKVGDRLRPTRPGDRRDVGRLQVVELREGHALARLQARGEAYPMRNDAVERLEARPLPPPAVAPLPRVNLQDLQPVGPARPGPENAHREQIYFLKGDATLSPAGQEKLQAWVGLWGRQGQWALLCPRGEAGLVRARLAVMTEALQRLGVAQVEVRPLPPEPTDRLDAVGIVMEPW
jgi:hypothetical protein